MYVVVPCKYGKDPIENSEDNAWTTFFYPYKVHGDFSNVQGHLTLQSMVKSRGISNSTKIIWMSMGIFSNDQGQITPWPEVGSG